MVGKVTVAMLERNLMRLYENYHAEDAPGKDFRYVFRPIRRFRFGSPSLTTLDAVQVLCGEPPSCAQEEVSPESIFDEACGGRDCAYGQAAAASLPSSPTTP